MADNSKKPLDSEIKVEMEEAPAANVDVGGDGGGWGGWGFSPLSYLADIQKAATVAAEEISRNAIEMAQTAAKTISETVAEDPESTSKEGADASPDPAKSDDKKDERVKVALDKLENASEETFLSQGLKVFDTSVETFASGAWKALGTALKGGATFVQQMENSASNLTDSIQHGGPLVLTDSSVPSFLETGKAFTAMGMQVLEQVGKETMDLLVSEAGILVERKSNATIDEDQFEEVTFDRCFYIYGGPEQLEELEALSNHYALLYNRRKAKLSPDHKTIYDGKLKEVQRIFDLGVEPDEYVTDPEKGQEVEGGPDGSIDELKHLHDSSIRKAAELAAGFASVLVGLAPKDIVQRTSGRLDTLNSEGVHRLSELCCFGVTQLLMLGKSIMPSASKVQDQEIEVETLKIDWPEDSVERAKIIRTKAQSITGAMETVFNSFITGISDVSNAYSAASSGNSEKSVEVKASALKERLRSDLSIAMGKIMDGLQYSTYLVLSTSTPAA